jgi:hypothetical protein
MADLSLTHRIQIDLLPFSTAMYIYEDPGYLYSKINFHDVNFDILQLQACTFSSTNCYIIRVQYGRVLNFSFIVTKTSHLGRHDKRKLFFLFK